MKQIKINDVQILVDEAESFSKFREDCKNYLSENGLNYDKFTVVNHDAIIGYISEKTIIDYLKKQLKGIDVTIESWEERSDLDKVKRIVKTNNSKQAETVKDYFYDTYDICVTNSKGQELFIDIKTALTAKTPKENWNFMYPVVQAHKKGKDYMLLAYCVVGDIKEISSIDNLTIVGYITEEMIKKCKIIYKGQYTRFGTRSQINNYETELSRDYKSIDDFVKLIKDFANK